MKMFFSAGVKFTASSCEATAGPPSLSWVTLASLDELLWLWEQHQIQQNQFHPDGNKRTEQYWEQNREVTGTVLILMTLRHTVHLNTLPNTPTLTRCSGMISLSDSLSPVIGSIMSFLINFSTHSMVTTAPLKEETQCFTYSQTVRRRTGQMAHVCTHEGLSTAQGMLLARTSLVTAHTYLSWRQRTQLDRTELH